MENSLLREILDQVERAGVWSIDGVLLNNLIRGPEANREFSQWAAENGLRISDERTRVKGKEKQTIRITRR